MKIVLIYFKSQRPVDQEQVQVVHIHRLQRVF